ncbi:MAG: hypothetical protein BWY36_00915 [Candidatus Diapherotrites archaeon ADurb.Bin253]|nr:MAG: hypothetical protein BWY36_00915 [Candidatus Diapherotrites archaeon ADurb.Bin253]
MKWEYCDDKFRICDNNKRFNVYTYDTANFIIQNDRRIDI